MLPALPTQAVNFCNLRVTHPHSSYRNKKLAEEIVFGSRDYVILESKLIQGRCEYSQRSKTPHSYEPVRPAAVRNQIDGEAAICEFHSVGIKTVAFWHGGVQGNLA